MSETGSNVGCTVAGMVTGGVAVATGVGVGLSVPVGLGTVAICKALSNQLSSAGVSTDGKHIPAGTSQAPNQAGAAVATQVVATR